MQIFKVLVTETAEFGIDEYFDYIALDSLPNAIAWHGKIYNKLESLSKMAVRCPIADENAFFKFEVRCLLIGEYRALYRINGEVVEVLHVKHPRMNK